jgi:mono/diheme cytochrome c family protein
VHPIRTAAALAILLPVLAFAQDVADAPADGALVFTTRCALCHGGDGHGDGRAARLYSPPPADLTASWRSTEYKLNIVRGGGASLGRSPAMPAWADTLSDDEIAAVVRYVDGLVIVYDQLALEDYCACAGG